MAAPNYSPVSGKGTTVTDNTGATFLFNGNTWDQISSGANSSHGASGSWIPVASPKTTPVPTTPNIPVQQPSGPSESDLFNQETQQINEGFNALNNVYGQQESNARSQADVAKGDITKAIELQKTDLTNAQEIAQRQLASNKNDTELSKRKATDSLRNDFNALNQSNQTRFGGGSSVGGALFELVSKTYLQNKGNIEQGYLKSIEKIGEEQANQNLQYQSALAKVNQAFNEEIHSIDSQLQDALTQIAGMRGQAEVWKRERMLGLLEQARQEAVAKQNYLLQVQDEIKLWKLQQNQSIADAIAYNKSLLNEASTNISNQNSQISSYGSGLLGYSPTQSTNTYASLYKKSGNNEDDLSSLNPWTA